MSEERQACNGANPNRDRSAISIDDALHAEFAGWPTSVRAIVIAVATLLMCACQYAGPRTSQTNLQLAEAPGQAPENNRVTPSNSVDQATWNEPPTNDRPLTELPIDQLPAQAAARPQPNAQVIPAGLLRSRRCRSGQCCPQCEPTGGCIACGTCNPRPDEFLCDGGDANSPAGVIRDGSFVGVDPEDTLAQYRTVDGRIVVQPSNRVCIYAPRFAAVRHVVQPLVHGQLDIPGGTLATENPVLEIDDLQPTTTRQQLEPLAGIGDLPPSVFRARQQGGDLNARQSVLAMQDALQPYANFDVIRSGQVDNAEKPRLAQSIVAAITWAHDLGVQVAIENQAAQLMQGDLELGLIFHVEEPNEPRIRIIKLASTCAAKPGEEVEFTLRFDNVGNREIDNVSIVDNLTTRLEYVEDSEKCSLDAQFSTARNEAGSLVLQWDIHNPIKPGEGGIIQFRCRVR